MIVEISNYEIIVSVAVVVVVVILWFINKKLAPKNKKVTFDIGFLVILVSILTALIIFALRSDYIKQNPLLTAVAALCLITSVSSLMDSFYTNKFRKDLNVISERLRTQVAGLGNMTFFSTKKEAFENLTIMTRQAKDKVLATRFSSADISVESEYWDEIRLRAMDQKIMSIRVHCIAHKSSSCIDGLCKIIQEFCGAKQFQLGITFCNNDFEMIIVDDKECVVCFHDLDMTIKNGFKVDDSLPSSASIVANFNDTYRNIINNCYLIIDFGKFVHNQNDVTILKNLLIELHKNYCDGYLPTQRHKDDLENYLFSLGLGK